MSEGAAVHTRETDRSDNAQQIITIDRKIPITWLLGTAGALALVLGGMYYQQQRTTETTADIKADVRAIKDDIAKQGRKAIDDDYTIRDLQRRLTVVETYQQAQRDQTKAGR